MIPLVLMLTEAALFAGAGACWHAGGLWLLGMVMLFGWGLVVLVVRDFDTAEAAAEGVRKSEGRLS